LKLIVSVPGLAFALRIAWRNEPLPLSFVFVTVNVAAIAPWAIIANPTARDLVIPIVTKWPPKRQAQSILDHETTARRDHKTTDHGQRDH
jgi:hypothetical protein